MVKLLLEDCLVRSFQLSFVYSFQLYIFGSCIYIFVLHVWLASCPRDLSMGGFCDICLAKAILSCFDLGVSSQRTRDVSLDVETSLMGGIEHEMQHSWLGVSCSIGLILVASLLGQAGCSRVEDGKPFLEAVLLKFTLARRVRPLEPLKHINANTLMRDLALCMHYSIQLTTFRDLDRATLGEDGGIHLAQFIFLFQVT